MLLINAFAYVDKSLNRNLNSFLKMEIQANHSEKINNFVSLMFSDVYLKKKGRAEALRSFFATRHSGLESAVSNDIEKGALSRGKMNTKKKKKPSPKRGGNRVKSSPDRGMGFQSKFGVLLFAEICGIWANTCEHLIPNLAISSSV